MRRGLSEYFFIPWLFCQFLRSKNADQIIDSKLRMIFSDVIPAVVAFLTLRFELPELFGNDLDADIRFDSFLNAVMLFSQARASLSQQIPNRIDCSPYRSDF